LFGVLALIFEILVTWINENDEGYQFAGIMGMRWDVEGFEGG